MADWSSLQPLRVHSRFMAVVALILAGVLFFTPRHAFRAQAIFNNRESNSLTSKVKAASGLSIRDQPTVNSTILTTAPNNARLTIIDENVAQDIVGGKNGSWYKVEYQGITGYAWGNYIDN
jgi:hypothetical protein